MLKVSYTLICISCVTYDCIPPYISSLLTYIVGVPTVHRSQSPRPWVAVLDRSYQPSWQRAQGRCCAGAMEDEHILQ